MPSDVRFAEPLPQLAAEAYALADRCCGTCTNMHALWPYLRLAGVGGGADAGRAIVESTLVKMFAAGHRRVLIAGAADAGVLALVARAGAGHDLDILVVDLCDTPLELCRRFAGRQSLKIRTQVMDLAHLDSEGQFDTILAHSLLQFIAPDNRVEFYSRLGRALRPGGRLVQVFNAGHRIPDEGRPEYRQQYAQWVLDELDRRKIPLPDSRDAFRQRVEAYAREREAREGAVDHPSELDRILEAAGLTIRRCEQIDLPLADSYQRFVAKLSKRRFLSEAELRA